MSETDKSYYGTIAWTLLGLSIFMWTLNTASRIYAQDVLNNGVQTKAVVERIVITGTIKIPIESPEVTYPETARPVVLRHITHMPKVGDKIQVIYHRNHPARAVMAGFNAWGYSFNIQTLVLVITPLTALLLAIVIRTTPTIQNKPSDA